MNHIAKLMVFLLLLVSITASFVSWTVDEVKYTVDSRSEYALKRATKDATSVLRSDKSESAKNANMDGYSRDVNDYEVDRDKVMEVFMKSLKANLNPRPKSDEEIEMNLVRGIATYDGFMMYTGKTGWRPLEPYSHYHEPSGTIYSFTLGDDLVVFRNDVKIETRLSSEPSPYTFWTMEELRDIAVMETISARVSDMTSETLASVVTGYKMSYDLPGFDKREAGGMNYNPIGNVLSSPGVIAIYDVTYPGFNETRRIANLAGAELGLQIEE